MTGADLIAEIEALERRVGDLRAAWSPPVVARPDLEAPLALGCLEDPGPATQRSWRTPALSLDEPHGPSLGDPAPPPPPDLDPPWPPWDLDSLPEPSTSGSSPDERLELVTAREKRNVDRVADVPHELVTSRRITTSTERPKSWNPRYAGYDWYPQIEAASLLHLRDGFIGDNVVFDRDRYYRLGSWWLGNSWELYRKTREVRHVDVGVSIGGWGGESFQLFVLAALPKLAALLDVMERPELAHAKIVSHDEGAPAARWFWDALGLRDRIVQKPQDARAGFVVHADVALFPHFEPNSGQFGLFPRGTLLPVQRRLGTLEPEIQDLVVYLERPGAKRHRSVANGDELVRRIEQVLAGTGYRLELLAGEGHLDADRALLKRAKVILGPHGGAFGNLVFLQPGTHVIEFLPLYDLFAAGRDPQPGYWGLAQAASLDYWTVAPENFDLDRPGMYVDVEEVAAILGHVLS